MIGSNSELIEMMLKRQWTFAEVMDMENIISQIVKETEFDIKYVVEYLNTKEDIMGEFLHKVTNHMKKVIIEELQTATVVLERPVHPLVDELNELTTVKDKAEKLKEEFFKDKPKKKMSKKELKEMIKKDTKTVGNNEVPEVQSGTNE